MYSGSFRSRPAFSSSVEVGSTNLCRNLWNYRSKMIKTKMYVQHWGHKHSLTNRMYLELLLAGANVDVSPPDHQPVACIWFAGYCAISGWLGKNVKLLACVFPVLHKQISRNWPNETDLIRMKIHLWSLPDWSQIRALSGWRATHSTARGAFDPRARGSVRQRGTHVYFVWHNFINNIRQLNKCLNNYSDLI